METFIAKTEVRKAKPEDLKTYCGYKDGKPFYKINIGLPYMLKSMITGEFEGWYMLTENSNLHEVKKWLENDMLFVSVRPFEKLTADNLSPTNQ